MEKERKWQKEEMKKMSSKRKRVKEIKWQKEDK